MSGRGGKRGGRKDRSESKEREQKESGGGGLGLSQWFDKTREATAVKSGRGAFSYKQSRYSRKSEEQLSAEREARRDRERQDEQYEEEREREREEREMARMERGRDRDDDSDEEEGKEAKAEELEDENEGKKKSKEDEENRRKKKEDKANEIDPSERIYFGHWYHSAEKRMVYWSVAKCLLYMILMAMAFRILTNNYDKKPCYLPTLRSGTEMCVLQNPVPGGISCSGLEETKYCLPLMVAAPSLEGCITQWTSETTFDISAAAKSIYADTCLDTSTCPDSKLQNIKNGVVFLAITYLLQVVQEAIYMTGLTVYAPFHPTDFKSQVTGWAHLAFFFVFKRCPFIAQLMWAATLIAFVYFFLQTYAFSIACEFAVDSKGAPNQFFPDAKLYIQMTGIVQLLFGIMGTWVRLHGNVRGEIFVPGDEDVCAPEWCECKSTRDKPRPRLCNGPACKTIRKCSIFVDIIIGALVFIFDNILNLLLILGWAWGWLWRNRHFVGP